MIIPLLDESSICALTNSSSPSQSRMFVQQGVCHRTQHNARLTCCGHRFGIEQPSALDLSAPLQVGGIRVWLDQDLSSTEGWSPVRLTGVGWRSKFPARRFPSAADTSKRQLPLADLEFLSMMPDKTGKPLTEITNLDELIVRSDRRGANDDFDVHGLRQDCTFYRQTS